MKLVFLVTPPFFGSKSMPRFASLLGEGLIGRGHTVTFRSAPSVISRVLSKAPGGLKQWGGYADQYLLFPRNFRRDLKSDPAETLYVLTDQGLGMWIPLIEGRPHVIHCHDLLAIRSALGEFPENRLRGSGVLYQRMILSGLRRGKNFISVSKATYESLDRVVSPPPGRSEIVPNALNRPPIRMDPDQASVILDLEPMSVSQRPILHVGGNQWYKNRIGVLRLYDHYAAAVADPRPLWMAGPRPTEAMCQYREGMPCRDLVTFIIDPDDERLDACYSLADFLLFPSLEEGFGWPVAEALSRGCPVITTGIPPMSEVGGDAAFYISRMSHEVPSTSWLDEGSAMIRHVLGLNAADRDERIRSGLAHASRFGSEDFLDACEAIYSRILDINL